MEDVKHQLVAMKSQMERAEDRSLGFFIAATGLSIVAISIGLASVPNSNPDPDTLNGVFRIGVVLTIVGLVAAFTRFFGTDPKTEPLFHLDLHRPFIHLRKRGGQGTESVRSQTSSVVNSQASPTPPTVSVQAKTPQRMRGEGAAVVVIVLLLVVFLLVYYASKWENTLTSGDLLIAMATIFLAYATVLLGQHSSGLTRATERLQMLENRRETRLRLQRLLQESDRAIAIEVASISTSISHGNIPQPQFNIVRNIAEVLGPDDEMKIRSLVLDILGAFRADLSKEAERINLAASTQDLFASLQGELRRAMPTWQNEMASL